MNIETIVVIVFLGTVYLMADALELSFSLYYTWKERRERRKRLDLFYSKELLKAAERKMIYAKLPKVKPLFIGKESEPIRFRPMWGTQILKHPPGVIAIDIKA